MNYELSEEECDAIACALREWRKVRAPYQSQLTDKQILQLAQRLGGDE